MIFLSHASKDKEFVRKLNLSFMSYGLRTFFDERDISVGDSIPKRIYESIDQSTHLIYVVSSHSVLSATDAQRSRYLRCGSSSINLESPFNFPTLNPGASKITLLEAI